MLKCLQEPPGTGAGSPWCQDVNLNRDSSLQFTSGKRKHIWMREENPLIPQCIMSVFLLLCNTDTHSALGYPYGNLNLFLVANWGDTQHIHHRKTWKLLDWIGLSADSVKTVFITSDIKASENRLDNTLCQTGIIHYRRRLMGRLEWPEGLWKLWSFSQLYTLYDP